MPLPQTSEVTEDQFKEFLESQGDGEAPEPEDDDGDEPASAEEESEEAEESEETEPDEETEASEGDEDEEESSEEPSQLNWDAIKNPAFKAERDQLVARAEKLERAHAKIQSEWTKASQARREEEGSLREVRTLAAHAGQWNQLLAQYPQLEKMITAEVRRLQNPIESVQVPAGMEKDPLFQYMRQAYEPMLQQLQQQNKMLQAKLGTVDQMAARDSQAESTRTLDGILEDARGAFKSMFQRDWTQQENAAVLKYMLDGGYLSNPKLAKQSAPMLTREIFREQYQKAQTRTSSERAKLKAKKFPARTKTGNPGKKSSSRDASTPEEAIQMALADQGYGI